MTDDTPDPVPGTAAYYALPREEQRRICEERVGLRLSKDGAFVSEGQPYAAGDPYPNPIDNW
jgi:hypothetical protein